MPGSDSCLMNGAISGGSDGQCTATLLEQVVSSTTSRIVVIRNLFNECAFEIGYSVP